MMLWGAPSQSAEANERAPVLSFGFGQGENLGLPKSPVLVVHSDRLFTDSAYGRRVAADMEARSAVLMAENRRIEAELRAEELDLAKRRAVMDPDAFRSLAQAFDQKVQETRRTQEVKFVEITNAREAARQQFGDISLPVLERIMAESGAAVILEQSMVFLSADSVDVTDLALSRIDTILQNQNMQAVERQTEGGGLGEILEQP